MVAQLPPIPSAGGQWAVQGPIVVEEAAQLGADIPGIAMPAVAGEVWTNTIQPLFAVPIPAIAGHALSSRDVLTIRPSRLSSANR